MYSIRANSFPVDDGLQAAAEEATLWLNQVLKEPQMILSVYQEISAADGLVITLMTAVPPKTGLLGARGGI